MSTRGGRVPGSEGYNDADIRALLACVAEVRPASKREWMRVLKLYRKRYAEPQMRSLRDVNSIKSKFRQILNLKLKAGAGGKPHASAMEAHKIQLEIQMRMHALMAEGRQAGADDASDDTDSDMETAAPAPTTHSAAPPLPPQASALSAPVFSPESARPVPVDSDAASVVRASPRRQPLAVATASTAPQTPAAAPLRTAVQPVVADPSAARASPHRRAASAPSAPQPSTQQKQQSLPSTVAAVSDAPEPLLAARLAALEQHNSALSTQLHAMNHTAQQQLAARVAVLEQQNGVLTGRLHAVSDAADALKSANYDLREQILQLQSRLARAEAENRELRAVSVAAAAPQTGSTSS